MAIEGIPNGVAVNPAMITLDQEKKKPESSAEAVQKDQEPYAATKGVKETEEDTPIINEKYLERVQKALDLSNVGREYKVYDKLGKLYIRVYDKESGEIIREIPPEDLTELAKSLHETSGVLVNQKV